MRQPMSLSPGDRLGVFEIVALIGAGGMGEVYRARDTRLNRTVALKVMRPEWAVTETSRRRFDRESRVISQLNHPNICALYDVGTDGDRQYLVMEFVEGETLAARIQRGPIPPADVIRLGQAMASGLDAAHRQNVVHRDFKPSNVILSKSGIKILDFGLARAKSDEDAAPRAETRTLNTTEVGTVLGTLPYMAPEQLKGQQVDARADVFALGAVLHEMATGIRAFDAASQADLIAAVIDRDPPAVSSLRPGVPALLDRVVSQCLSKDPDARPHTGGEVARSLALVSETGPQSTVSRSAAIWQRHQWIWLLVASMLAIGLLVALRRATLPRTAEIPEQPLMRFEVPLPSGGELAGVIDISPLLAISPDGRHAAFVLRTGDVSRLWLHSFARMQSHPMAGTDGAQGPFWSPDSRHIAFFGGGNLKRISVDGEIVERICQTPTSHGIGTWGARGTILFSTFPGPGQPTLQSVPADGGRPETVASVMPMPIWPHFLPDGRSFLVGAPTIARASLDAPSFTQLVDARSTVVYSRTGHVLYVRDGSLVARPFDLAAGRVTGEPRVIADDVQFFTPTGGAAFSASDTGALVYHRADYRPRRIAWFAREGQELPAAFPEAQWEFQPRLSPDGSRLVIGQRSPRNGSTDLWMFELGTGTPVRLSDDEQMDNWPAWGADGRSLVLSRNFTGPPQLAQRSLTDPGTGTLLLPPGNQMHYSPDVASNGTIAFGMAGDVWLLRRGSAAPEPLVQTRFAEGSPAFSRDEQWLAYDSDVSGRSEVYVRPFGRAGEPLRVSTAGGRAPRWRADGREIYFLDLEGRIAAAFVTPVSEGIQAGRPVTVVTAPLAIEGFDVTRDGQRFITVFPKTDPARTTSSLVVVLNWRSLLREGASVRLVR